MATRTAITAPTSRQAETMAQMSKKKKSLGFAASLKDLKRRLSLWLRCYDIRATQKRGLLW
jgi:hypothetical protein